MAKRWLVLRVQSNREVTVSRTLEEKIKIEALEEVITRVLVPTESVSVIKAGKRRVMERKLYPGYVFIEMNVNEDGTIPEKAWFLIRETSGVGDFIGTEGGKYSKPTPMMTHEVEKMLGQVDKAPDQQPSLKIDFKKGDSVKIKEGPFENFDGVVDEVIPSKGLVKVIVTIFGRPTPVELEYWMVELI
jgi:transcription termination/antitermination protein NusG